MLQTPPRHPALCWFPYLPPEALEPLGTIQGCSQSLKGLYQPQPIYSPSKPLLASSHLQTTIFSSVVHANALSREASRQKGKEIWGQLSNVSNSKHEWSISHITDTTSSISSKHCLPLSPQQTSIELGPMLGMYRRRQWHPTPVLLPGEARAWRRLVGCSPWVAKSRTRLSDFTFPFHFHAMEKEMAPHSSVLAWRIPGTGEPGGLPSMESHRVGHD